MDSPPDHIARLDRIFATARIAHESVYELHRRAALILPDDDRSDALLTESAKITLTELPSTLVAATELRARWAEQIVLDHPGADRTLKELQAELERTAPQVMDMLGRQRRIARALQALLGRTTP